MNESELRTHLSRTPHDHRARQQLSQLLVDAGRFVEAEQLLAAGLRLAPDNLSLLYAHGESLLDIDQVSDAIAAFRRVAQAKASSADVLVSLGGALLRQREYAEAAAVLEQAVGEFPQDMLVFQLWGEACSGCGLTEKAMMAYGAAWNLGLRDRAVAFYVGSLCCERQQYARAIGFIQAGIKLPGEVPEPWHNLGKAHFELGDVAAACDAFQAGVHAGDDSSLRELAIIAPGNPRIDHEEVRKIRRAYAEQIRMDVPAWTPPSRQFSPNERLRIGYISSFFAHPNYMKPVFALLMAHDADRVDVELFHDGPPSTDLERAVAESAVSTVFDVSNLSNRELVQAIRGRNLDLLIDLNAYSAAWRLPIYTARLARTTVGWFNHYATSGFDGIDVIIGDRQCYDDSESGFYSERLLALPVSYLAFRVDHPCPDIVSPPSLQSDVITFGSLCSQYKITPEVLAAWARIVTGVPNSRLLLANRTLESEDCRNYVLQLLERLGVSREQVDLRGGGPHHEYLKNYNDMDFALDAWPYNGGTTTTEAMWQGVPVLCFRGDRWASRTSASLVADSPFHAYLFGSLDDMIIKAIELGNDRSTPGTLKRLRDVARDQLRESAVCDVSRLAHSLEDIYRSIAASAATPHP